MPISIDDRRYLLMCDRIRKDSHDPVRQVGSLIVDKHGEILAEGTNSPPPSLCLTVGESHEAIDRDPSWKYFMLEHAERSAIFSALRDGKRLDGATMYGTLFPCADCARAIIAAGISRLVVLGTKDPIRDEKWLEHYDYAEKIFALSGLVVDVVDPKELHDSQ